MGDSNSSEMNISSAEAMEIAQSFLDVVYPGTEADEILPYYGYYTVMTTKDGEHYGMLSVDGSSGDVWYHTWHGSYARALTPSSVLEGNTTGSQKFQLLRTHKRDFKVLGIYSCCG